MSCKKTFSKTFLQGFRLNLAKFFFRFSGWSYDFFIRMKCLTKFSVSLAKIKALSGFFIASARFFRCARFSLMVTRLFCIGKEFHESCEDYLRLPTFFLNHARISEFAGEFC